MLTNLLSVFKGRYGYVKDIAGFTRRRIISGNIKLLVGLIISGVACRILGLVGFAMTLQAIVGAIRPNIFMPIIEQIEKALSFSLGLRESDVVFILIGIVIVIFVTNLISHRIRAFFSTKLNYRLVYDERNFCKDRLMDDDIFLVEQLPPTVQSIEKCFEIFIFMVLIIMMILFVSPDLVLLLLPLVCLIVIASVYGDRSRLRDVKRQQDARKTYVNRLDPDGKLRKHERPSNNKKRDQYLKILNERRQQETIKPQIDALVGACAMCIIVYYLSRSGFDTQRMAGTLLIFVVGVRYLIASVREFGVNFSRVLELRKNSRLLKVI
jgi:hypothetical protein